MRATTVVLAALFVASSLSAAERLPNIVLMYADNLGYGDLGCYGNTGVKTPRIDELAKQGVRCTQFYVVTSSCTPSRGAILTGRYPLRNGLAHQLVKEENWYGVGLPHRERIVPQYLKSAGYATGCFGKWNIGLAEGSRPTERGFDEFFGCRSGNIHYTRHTYHEDYDIFRGTERTRVEGYSTELFADAACDFVRRQKDRPFFLYLPFNAPHFAGAPNHPPGEQGEPWLAPEKYLQRYGKTEKDATPQDRYWAVLTAMDDAVGRVLDVLDEQKLRDDTLVMFLSDMGAILEPDRGLGVASNGPFRGGAPSVYEGGVRVPAIFRWPGRIKPAAQHDGIVCQLDILPLCLAAARLQPPTDRVLDGIDPSPALIDGGVLPRHGLVYGYAKAAALRNGSNKIVRSKESQPWELYDLASDPGETNDLAKSQPELVGRLAASYNAWRLDIQKDASPPEKYAP